MRKILLMLLAFCLATNTYPKATLDFYTGKIGIYDTLAQKSIKPQIGMLLKDTYIINLPKNSSAEIVVDSIGRVELKGELKIKVAVLTSAGDLNRVKDIISYQGLKNKLLKEVEKNKEISPSVIYAVRGRSQKRHSLFRGIWAYNNPQMQKKIKDFLVGYNLFKKGKYQKAVKSFKEFVKKHKDPKSVALAYYYSGLSYYQMGDYDKADEMFTEALRASLMHKGTNRKKFYLMKFGVLVKQYKLNEAAAVIDAFSKEYPLDLDSVNKAYIILGISYKLVNQDDAAYSFFEKVLKTADSNSELYKIAYKEIRS